LIWPISLVVWIAVGTVVVTSLLTTIGALFPMVTARTREAAVRGPARSAAVGLVNGLFLVALGLALRVMARRSDVPPWLVTLPVLLVLGVGLAIGCAAVAGVVGERIWPERSAHQQRAMGAVVSTLACLTPVIGWFALFPYVAALGLGGFILSAVQKSSTEE
jgi:Na+/melibiose symporter-like transporter